MNYLLNANVFYICSCSFPIHSLLVWLQLFFISRVLFSSVGVDCRLWWSSDTIYCRKL